MASVEAYLKPEVVQQIGRLDLKARFIAQGFITGLHASPYHGFSVEFSEHRKYEPGDEFNTIDWSVYARTERVYVKKFRAETNTQSYLVVDTSPSMGYSYRGITKLDYAICLAASLGYLMIRQQDPVGLVTFDSAIRTAIPPRCKRSQLTTIISELSKTRPSGVTDIANAIHQVAELARRRGFIIIFSDFLGEIEPMIDALRHLAFRKHDVIVFQILDEAEVKLPFDEFTNFQDLETAETLAVDPNAIRASYQAEINEFISTLRERCLQARVDFQQLDTSMAFDKALMSFLVARKARF
ncbi:MAG TPA: DUF58 domain-containing protein [Planctomycetota bacterium]|jgi:uncharacterized protein (DUF58 family)